MKRYFLLPAVLLLLAMRPAHPLKMCVCQVKYQPDTKRLGLTFRFFHDDLERALEQQTGRDLTLTQITADNNRLLTDFVKKQFDLTINGKRMELRHVQSSIDDVVLVVEFTAETFTPANVYEVDLSNRMLLDVFPDQYNIVRFDFFGNGNLETMRFEREERRLVRRMGF